MPQGLRIRPLCALRAAAAVTDIQNRRRWTNLAQNYEISRFFPRIPNRAKIHIIEKAEFGIFFTENSGSIGPQRSYHENSCSLNALVSRFCADEKH